MELKCTKTCCLLCTMNEPNLSLRRSGLAKCFSELPRRDDQELVTILSGIWNIAVAQPDDAEFPSLGVFECMAELIDRGIKDRTWLLRGKNVYIPYYAAHIIGSYTMNKAQFAEMAVESGVILPLMELLRGKISWVEQRVAVRALGHLASHNKTFKAICAHDEEIVKLSMQIASTSLETVYNEFVGLKSDKRLEYHCDLMIRRRRGTEMENKKAAEWASQLQSWSLYLLNCFAIKKRCINLICKEEFLEELCGMWGALENQNSFSGVGLVKSLCLTKDGRKRIANSKKVIQSLGSLSRSSDEWQCKAIEILLLLLKDQDTRYGVMEIVVPFLVDLVELRNIKGRRKVGDTVTQVLLQDYGRIKYGQLVLESKTSQEALEEVWNLKVERRKRDDTMSEQEFRERKLLVGMLKSEGNQKFWSGESEEAMAKYTKALDLCPLKMKKERIVLYSNRAQCNLLLNQAESAISDATRAICLSDSTSPHTKSLWRRSQAYDMNGQARESLVDCLTFLNERIKLKTKRHVKIPFYAVRMMNKQINSTYLFAVPADRKMNDSERRKSMTKDQITKKKMARKMNEYITAKLQNIY